MIGLKKAVALPFGFLRRKAVTAQSCAADQMEVALLQMFSWGTAAVIASPIEAVIHLALEHQWT